MRKRGRFGLQVLLGAGCILVSLALVGCGSGAPMGKVTGKVTYNAQPVKDGDLTFVPVSGPADKETPRQPGVAVIENGAFTATTVKPGDGLGVGKYTVSFNARNPPFEAPEYDGVGPPPEAPKSEYIGLVPKESQIEIKDGSNDLTIELIKGQ
jgi:hypothetical protein